MSLPIHHNLKPILYKARDILLAIRNKIDAGSHQLLADDVVESTTNPACTKPVVPITKPSEEVRL